MEKLELYQMENVEGGKLSGWCIAAIAGMGVAIAGATMLTGGIGGIVLFQLGLASSGASILGACKD
jgi:hypothetical protein